MAEDLEFNPFFAALQGRFSSQYERAQQNCWLVCIPTAASLQNCTINKQFIEKHILEPSGLLRDVYASTGTAKLIWRLNGNELHCTSTSGNGACDHSVRVLAEELAYNKSLKQFKMFIIEKPLDLNYKEPQGLKRSGGKSPKSKNFLERRKTYEEHRKFLESFANYREGLEELNRQIRLFKQNYLVVEKESLLLDTAAKLDGLVRQGNAAFLEANRHDSKLQDRRILDACWVSLEGYLMHHVCSKVFPAVRGVHAHHDRQFIERCQRLRGKLTPSLVGVPRDYECQYPTTLAHLRLLDRLETPLEILYTVQDAMDSIMADVKDHFVKSLRVGEPLPLASDDLIAVVATILVRVDFKCLLSSLYYVEHFHWASDSDQLSYTLVTFRAAVEYLRGPEVCKWLPKDQPTRSQSLSSYTGPVDANRHSLSPNHSLTTSEESSSSGSGHPSSSRDGGPVPNGRDGGRISSFSPTLLSLQFSERDDKRHHKPPAKPQDSGGLG